MSVDFNEINTVNDLLKVQEQVSDDVSMSPEADNLTRLLLDEEPRVGVEVCCRILYALREFHGNGIDVYIADGKPDHAAQWASDYTKINMALDLIKDIQV